MCGVFGFVSNGKGGPNIDRLSRIAEVTQRRGRHAWGIAWIDSRGVLRCYKQEGPVGDSLALLEMAADARLLIGHCRYTTQGAQCHNINNHPHPADGGWIVHNGVIGNYGEILQRYPLWPSSECDSEVLGLLIEHFKGSLISRVQKAVGAVDPERPLVMLGLWKPGRLVVVRRGNPLYFGDSKAGTYLSSLPDGLPGKAREADDGKLAEITGIAA